MRLLRPMLAAILLLGSLIVAAGLDCDPLGEIDHDGDELVMTQAM
jgi:hypothetical protein